MLQGKTIFDVQATTSLRNWRFDEKSATKSASAGTNTEAHFPWPETTVILNLVLHLYMCGSVELYFDKLKDYVNRNLPVIL